MQAPPLVVANGVQVRLIWDLDNNLAVNVLNCSAAASVVIDQTLAEILDTNFKTAHVTHLALLQANSVALARVGVRDISRPNQAEFVSTGPPSYGQGLGDALPFTVAMGITLRTPMAGKSFRGRVYLPGFDENVNAASGTILASDAQQGVDFIDAIKGDLATQNLTLCVLSKPSYKVQLTRSTWPDPDADPIVEILSTTTAKSGQLTPVISAESRNVGWETQRRRHSIAADQPGLLKGPVARSRPLAR